MLGAILCRMFLGEEYVSFFTSINSDETFPGCIHRPIGNKTPLKYIPILKNLYYTNAGTYFEVDGSKNYKVEYMFLAKN